MHYSDLRKNDEDPINLRSSLENSIPIFQKPFQYRSESDHDQMFLLLNKIPHFREHFEIQADKVSTLQQLSEVFEYKHYPKYEAIYHHGSMPQKFHLILKGEIRSFVPKTPHELETDILDYVKYQLDKKKRKQNHSHDLQASHTSEHLHKTQDDDIFQSFNLNKKYFEEDVLKFKRRKVYIPGDYISELSIAFSTPEEDTLVAMTDVHMVSISKKVYREIFKDIIKETQDKFSFFGKLFPTFNDESLINFGYSFEKMIFGSNYKIFQQGMSPDQLYLIKQGEVELWENINIEEEREEGKKGPGLVMKAKPLHKLEKKFNGEQGVAKASVVLLSQGQFFGEEILTGINERIFSAITKSVETVVYSITGYALLRLAVNHPELISYLKSQTTVSFESKMNRLSNLKKGLDKVVTKGKLASTALSREVAEKNRSGGVPVEAEVYDKDIVSLYFNGILKKKENPTNAFESARIQTKEEKIQVSPKAARMYKKMADLKAAMISDKVKVSPKLLTEIQETESHEDEVLMPDMSGTGVDLTKKFYFPDQLWKHTKEFYAKKTKKIKIETLEKQLARKIIEEARCEEGRPSIMVSQKCESKLENEDTGRGAPSIQDTLKKVLATSPLYKINRPQEKKLSLDSYLMKEINSPKDKRKKGFKSSQFTNKSAAIGLDSPKLNEIAILDYYEYSLPAKQKEKQPSYVFLSSIESNRIKSPIDKREREPNGLSVRGVNTKRPFEKLDRIETVRSMNAKVFQSLSPKLSSYESLRGSPMTKPDLSVQGKELGNIFSLGVVPQIDTVTDEDIESTQSSPSKIHLPKINGSKILSSKHSMFRLKPTNAQLVGELYSPKRTQARTLEI